MIELMGRGATFSWFSAGPVAEELVRLFLAMRCMFVGLVAD
jgi:hypothetical protein